MTPGGLKLILSADPLNLKPVDSQTRRRPRFRAGDYTVRPSAAESVHSLQNTKEFVDYLIDFYDGPLRAWIAAKRYTDASGRTWQVFQDPEEEFCVETEILPDDTTGEVRDVEPERAYAIACELDALRRFKVIHE